MKKILMVILLVMFAGSVYGVEIDFLSTYTSRGVVTFDHTMHSAEPDSCVVCHDLLESFGGEVNKDFGHKGCKDCHKLLESKVAPTTCTACHVKQK